MKKDAASEEYLHHGQKRAGLGVLWTLVCNVAIIENREFVSVEMCVLQSF